MSEIASSPYYLQNVKTKKFAIVGSNNFIETGASNHAIFNIELVSGQDVYKIIEHKTGYHVGAEITGKPRRLKLQLAPFEWTIAAAGTAAWK
ncbi:hypothetical protein PQX77_018313 [Marasmius sp. AFHP31]|nr:hypothetical protein PQX77_018313 [Marasmius sp. AFHP31]